MAISAPAPSSTPFDVITVVWGPEYRQLFVEVCVPNQLTPGNLGALPPGSRYRVFTSAEDVEFLAASPALVRANDVIPVDLVVEPELARSSENRFTRMTACHSAALMDAAKSGAALIFLSPDLVMSEGTLAALVRRYRSGARSVVCPGLRVERDTFVAALHARGGVRAIPSRELVSVALDHLHPSTRLHMTDSECRPRRPVGVYWNVPGEGILARCFYLHPLMVDPPRRDVLPGETIDHHYLVHACPVREQIHVASDSDELVVFEMSPAEAGPTESAPGRISPWETARYLCRCDSHQQSYWQIPLRLHTGEIGAAWPTVEEESARFANRAVRLSLPAWWLHRTSRRVGPLRRRVGAFNKRIRRAAKMLTAWRVRRVVLVARTAQKFHDRSARTGRRLLRRMRRTVVLLAHSATRPIQKLRKRAVRMGRRVLVR